MKKFLFILLFIIPLFAENINYSILKNNNQLLLNTTQEVINNKHWMDKFYSLSTYTKRDYSKIFTVLYRLLEAENVLLDRYVPSVNADMKKFKYEKNSYTTLNKQVLKYLGKSPDKLQNIYYLLDNYKKMLRIHQFFLEKYQNSNDYVFQQIYLKKYPTARKYVFLQNNNLYFYFDYVEKANTETFNKFIKDLKENSYWFLRYFGKSIKFADEIQTDDL